MFPSSLKTEGRQRWSIDERRYEKRRQDTNGRPFEQQSGLVTRTGGAEVETIATRFPSQTQTQLGKLCRERRVSRVTRIGEKRRPVRDRSS